MQMVEGQVETFKKWIDNGFNKSTLVRAISQMGAQKVMDCIDAVEFDWSFGEKPKFENKNIQLTSLLKINGLSY